MEIEVDPGKPVLWVRVSGLTDERGVTVFELRPGTVASPDVVVVWALDLGPADEGKVRALTLPRDPSGAHLLCAALRVTASFEPAEGERVIKVEFLPPTPGIHPPEPIATVSLKTTGKLVVKEDVYIKEKA